MSEHRSGCRDFSRPDRWHDCPTHSCRIVRELSSERSCVCLRSCTLSCISCLCPLPSRDQRLPDSVRSQAPQFLWMDVYPPIRLDYSYHTTTFARKHHIAPTLERNYCTNTSEINEMEIIQLLTAHSINMSNPGS